MSSDIELGDDESITLACTQLRARHTFTSDAVQVFGDLRVQNRVFLDAPPALPSSGVPRAPDARSIGSISSPFGSSLIVAKSDGSASYTGGAKLPADSASYTGGAKLPAKKYKEVYLRLAKRPVPVDLWEELQMLREAVLDLHARLKKRE